MSKRLKGVFAVALVLLAVGLLAAPALAVEGEATEGPAEQGPAPSIDDIGTQNDVSREFVPLEPTEEPPFFKFFYIPLIVAGVLIVAALLFAYLTWQPRFAEERRSRKRRR